MQGIRTTHYVYTNMNRHSNDSCHNLPHTDSVGFSGVQCGLERLQTGCRQDVSSGTETDHITSHGYHWTVLLHHTYLSINISEFCYTTTCVYIRFYICTYIGVCNIISCLHTFERQLIGFCYTTCVNLWSYNYNIGVL